MIIPDRAQQLQTYLKKYSILSHEECKKAVSELETIPTSERIEEGFIQHSFYDVKTDSINKSSNELDVTVIKIESNDIIMSRLWGALDSYIKYLNMPWFSTWEGYTEIRYNKYSENTEMRYHCDHIHSMFDGTRKGIPILTMLGALNDNYEGGELKIWDKIVKINAGEVLIFPSNFLFPHGVEKVSKGKRYSYVSWVW